MRVSTTQAVSCRGAYTSPARGVAALTFVFLGVQDPSMCQTLFNAVVFVKDQWRSTLSAVAKAISYKFKLFNDCLMLVCST